MATPISSQVPTATPGLRSENKSAFLDFEGVEEIAMIAGSSESNSRNYFKPKALEGLSPPQVWDWWQKRRQSESVLKSAVANGQVDVTQYFETHKQYLAADKAEVLQAHADFFRAIAEGDLSLMRALWLESDDTVCVQPGGTGWVVNGYKNIIALWSLALATAQPNMHTRDIQMFFQGDAAMVTCTVDTSITTLKASKGKRGNRSKATKGKIVNSYYATMILTRPHNTDRYLLSAFVASNTPATEGKKEAQSLKITYQDPLRPKKKKEAGGPISLQQLLGGGINLGAMGDDDDDDDGEEEEEGDEEVEISMSSDDLDDEDEDDDLSYDSDDDDDNDDDSDYDSEAGEKNEKQRFKNNMRNALRKTMSRLVSGGKGSKGMIVIQSGSGPSISSIFNGGGSGGTSGGDLKGLLSKLAGRKGDDDEEDDDDDDDDDDDESIGKELAARTLLAVRWLNQRGRLSREEKRVLNNDVIKNVGGSRFSRAEVAFSLLIGDVSPNSGSRYGAQLAGSSRNPMDMSLVDAEDMLEFEDLCHRIAHDLLQAEKSSDNYRFGAEEDEEDDGDDDSKSSGDDE